MAWHLGRLAAFDLETTDKDAEQARIVEAYVGRVGGGLDPVDHLELLVNPGVEVPEEAVKIHGYTTEFLREYGEDAANVVEMTVCAVAAALQEGIPLVGHNIRYDLTVLDRECRRYQLPTVADRTGGRIGPVVDTCVLSKRVDPWRRRVSEEQGAHVLKTCAQVFRVEWVDDDAHGARYDALVSARVAYRIGQIAHAPRDQRPRLSGGSDQRYLFDAIAVDLQRLHANQVLWAAEQAASLQRWKRSEKAGEQRDPDAVVPGDWPVTPFREPALTP